MDVFKDGGTLRVDQSFSLAHVNLPAIAMENRAKLKRQGAKKNGRQNSFGQRESVVARNVDAKRRPI